jgi:hypothetical protein
VCYNGITASGRAAGRFNMLNTGLNANKKLTVLYARLSKEDDANVQRMVKGLLILAAEIFYILSQKTRKA